MSDVVVFDNQEFGTIRTMEINGQPYWVAKDVTKALGYSQSHVAVRRHCYDRSKRTVTDSMGRPQETYIIPESDLYRLIVHSKLPSAKRFEPPLQRERETRTPDCYGGQIPPHRPEGAEKRPPHVQLLSKIVLCNTTFVTKTNDLRNGFRNDIWNG